MYLEYLYDINCILTLVMRCVLFVDIVVEKAVARADDVETVSALAKIRQWPRHNSLSSVFGKILLFSEGSFSSFLTLDVKSVLVWNRMLMCISVCVYICAVGCC